MWYLNKICTFDWLCISAWTIHLLTSARIVSSGEVELRPQSFFGTTQSSQVCVELQYLSLACPLEIGKHLVAQDLGWKGCQKLGQITSGIPFPLIFLYPTQLSNTTPPICHILVLANLLAKGKPNNPKIPHKLSMLASYALTINEVSSTCWLIICWVRHWERRCH